MIFSDRGISRRQLMVWGVAAAATFALGIPTANAQSLDDARAAGYVGERPDGYIGQVDPSAPAWAANLVDEINAERRQRYQELADTNGTSVDAVQVVAAQKIIDRLPSGSYYMDAGGSWVQK